jgi:hypothetical protein
MTEKNQTSENQTTIENITTLLKKQDHTGRYFCKKIPLNLG